MTFLRMRFTHLGKYSLSQLRGLIDVCFYLQLGCLDWCSLVFKSLRKSSLLFRDDPTTVNGVVFYSSE